MRGLAGRVTRGYARTAVVGAATAGLLIAALGTASSADAEFSNGTAKATAIVSNVAPGVGSLQLGIVGGVAVSEIKNTVGQAQAKTLDLGLIGSTLTAEGCDGGAALVKQSDLPQALRVDSRGGAAKAAEDELPVLGAQLGVGRKEVEATQDPTAKAVSTLAEALTGILDIEGGRAEATTKVIKGEAREAHATVDVNLNLGGVLKLGGLRWDAFHRTGKDPKATADFDLGTASLLGIPIPLDSLADAEGVVNSLLETSGVSIHFPKVERFTEPADLVRITPLQILLKDSPLGAATVGQVLNITREARTQLFEEISKSICQAAGGVLIADIGLSVISGTGFLKIEIGGAEATTGDLVLESPFGGDEGTGVTPPPPASTPTVPGSSFVPAPATGGNPGYLQPVADVGPLTDRCESAHPLRHTACSRGALLAVGLVGVLATAGVGALDWQHQRRRRARAGGAS